MDVCREKGIACYDLVLGSEDFSIDRISLNNNDYSADIVGEENYIELLSELITKKSFKITNNTDKLNAELQKGILNTDSMISVFRLMLDFLCDLYFLKTAVNRVFNNQSIVVSKDDVSTISVAISQIEEFISIGATANDNMKKQLVVLFKENKVSKTEFGKLSQLVFRVDSLITKINTLTWPKLF